MVVWFIFILWEIIVVILIVILFALIVIICKQMMMMFSFSEIQQTLPLRRLVRLHGLLHLQHRLTVLVLVTWLTDLVKELPAVSSGLSRAGRLLQARVKENSAPFLFLLLILKEGVPGSGHRR